MKINIRMVTPEDLDAVAKVEEECFPPAEAAERSSIEKRIATFPECFYVAEAEGRLIGFINGCVTDEPVIRDELFHDATLHQPEGPYQTVFGLDVLPEYRRHGIAASLMEKLIEVAKAAGKKGMVLTCKDHLIHYYEKFGYVNRGVSKSTHGGATWYDMVYEFDI